MAPTAHKHKEPLSEKDKAPLHQALFSFPTQPPPLPSPSPSPDLPTTRLTVLPSHAFALAVPSAQTVLPSHPFPLPDHTKYHLLGEAFPDSSLVQQSLLCAPGAFWTPERELTLPTLIIIHICSVTSAVFNSLQLHGLYPTSVHQILQARILEWVAMPFSRGCFRTRDQNVPSMSSALAGAFFTTAIWEATWAY